MYYRNGTAILWITKTISGVNNYIDRDYPMNKSILSNMGTEELFPMLDEKKIINKSQKKPKYCSDRSSGF